VEHRRVCEKSQGNSALKIVQAAKLGIAHIKKVESTKRDKERGVGKKNRGCLNGRNLGGAGKQGELWELLDAKPHPEDDSHAASRNLELRDWPILRSTPAEG